MEPELRGRGSGNKLTILEGLVKVLLGSVRM